MSPQTIVATVISTYWMCVILMSVRSWLKFGVPSGSLPKTRLEKRMWMIWVPTIIAWVALSWRTSEYALLSGTLGMGLKWVFAIVAVIAFLLTVSCWFKMGRNWSMAVRPDKKTDLITDGVFSNVRHPIYALSLALMICTVLVVQSWAVLIVGVIHCSMLILKSLNEEQYLTQMHGQEYLSYLARTNRFIPIRTFAGQTEI